MTIGPKIYNPPEHAEKPVGFEFERGLKQAVRVPMYDKMANMVCQDRFEITDRQSGGVRRQTPRGLYKSEGQPRFQFTRAWLELGPYERVNFMTDVIDVSTGQVRVVEDSEARQFYISPMREEYGTDTITSVHLESDFHETMRAKDEVVFWQHVSDSLEYIDQSIQVAPDVSVPRNPEDRWPTTTLPANVANYIFVQ